MKELEKIFINFLKKQGLRYTPERKEVLHGILQIHKHFDADDLYDFLKAHNGVLSRATVYRSLPLFLESNILRESPRSEGRAHYEITYGHEHHDHLICLSCGKIIEFKHDMIEQLQNKVCKEYDFKPLDHSLSIRGYCKECENKNSKT